MPVCDCGTRIQNGQQCKQCALAERHETSVEDRDEHDPDLERCTDCDELINVEPMETCPNCGSWGRLPVDDPETEVAD